MEEFKMKLQSINVPEGDFTKALSAVKKKNGTPFSWSELKAMEDALSGKHKDWMVNFCEDLLSSQDTNEMNNRIMQMIKENETR